MDGETFNNIAVVVVIFGAIGVGLLTLGVFVKLMTWLFR